MVYDEATKEWVPRFGMGSIKKVTDKHKWLMEETKEHRAAGLDPFTFEKNKNKLA